MKGSLDVSEGCQKPFSKILTTGPGRLEGETAPAACCQNSGTHRRREVIFTAALRSAASHRRYDLGRGKRDFLPCGFALRCASDPPM